MIISKIDEHDDDPMGWVNLVDYNSSDYDEHLSDVEANDTEAVNYEIPPPPGVTVIVHLEDDQSKLKKICNQKRNMRRHLIAERHQQ